MQNRGITTDTTTMAMMPGAIQFDNNSAKSFAHQTKCDGGEDFFGSNEEEEDDDEGESYDEMFHDTIAYSPVEPPSQDLAPSSTASFIFERNVEDPAYINTIPLSPTPSNSNVMDYPSTSASIKTSNSTESLGKGSVCTMTLNENNNILQRRRTLENLVAPALDASCSIITDKNTNLNDVDMIYSRRPSTIGLDMALGRRNTFTAPPHRSSNRLSLSRSYSNAHDSTNCGSTNCTKNKVLRYYSYADMLSDEHNKNTSAHPSPSVSRRPSIITSLSTSYLKDYHNRNSSTSSSTTRDLTSKTVKKSPQSKPSRFHIESSGSEDVSTDDEDPHCNAEAKAHYLNRRHTATPSVTRFISPTVMTPQANIGTAKTRSKTPQLVKCKSYTMGLSPPNTPSSVSYLSGTNTKPNEETNQDTQRRRRTSSNAAPLLPPLSSSSSYLFLKDDSDESSLQTAKVGEVLRKRVSRTNDSFSIPSPVSSDSSNHSHNKPTTLDEALSVQRD